MECIDRLRDTMQSHERCSVVEVMGRHAGYLALYVGVAVGATAVLVPEHQYDFEKHVAEKIRAARLGGKTNFMIVVAEGAASAMDVGKEIKEHLGLDPRVTILGHIQRGGQSHRQGSCAGHPHGLRGGAGAGRGHDQPGHMRPG